MMGHLVETSHSLCVVHTCRGLMVTQDAAPGIRVDAWGSSHAPPAHGAHGASNPSLEETHGLGPPTLPGMAWTSTALKRQKEQLRRERQQRKAARKQQRRAELSQRLRDAPSGVDRDLVGIVPGPQPAVLD